MISVEEARARILAGLRPTPAETVPLASAWSRVLAAPVHARLTQPPENVSAMDGYAVRAAEAAAGARLHVIGSAPAGHPFSGVVKPGEAVRLFTGSVVPEGADTVLIQENARAEGSDVVILDAAAPGRHIRARGQDFASGDLLIAPGRKLSSRDIALAAAANYPWLPVHRRPQIAVLATGDELALPGEEIPAGGIINSNAHALAAIVRAGGGDPILLPTAPDDSTAIAAAAGAAAAADMLVTVGGASVGDHDLVRAALGGRGFAMDFWKVAMRPGKPLMHGHLGDTPVLGLPGNPVSAIVCAILFLVPALARLSGLPGDPPATVRARLGAPLRPNDSRTDFLRAALAFTPEGLIATPFPQQDSAMLRALARAEALILRPPQAPGLDTGAEVDVILLAALGL